MNITKTVETTYEIELPIEPMSPSEVATALDSLSQQVSLSNKAWVAIEGGRIIVKDFHTTYYDDSTLDRLS